MKLTKLSSRLAFLNLSMIIISQRMLKLVLAAELSEISMGLALGDLPRKVHHQLSIE